MHTKYVYTLLAERIAKDNKIPEYRKAGTAASFAGQPMEESPEILKSWLDGGIVEEVSEPVNFLTLTFNTTLNHDMAKLFQYNHIKYYYDHFGRMCADIHKTGNPVKVDCFHVATDTETGLDLFEVKEVF